LTTAAVVNIFYSCLYAFGYSIAIVTLTGALPSLPALA